MNKVNKALQTVGLFSALPVTGVLLAVDLGNWGWVSVFSGVFLLVVAKFVTYDG